jgi:hypothetical protein
MEDYSQYGESKILLEIFEKIGTENNYVVEFGASDGFWLSNARMFINMGWDSLLMDGIEDPNNGVNREFITAENINELFEKYSVPKKFDLLSIDIDGNDYWVWKELKYEPNVVIIEYNSNFDVNENYVLSYNPKHNFYESGGYYSASVMALVELGKKKGYFLHREVSFTNLIFVKDTFKNELLEFDYKQLNLPEPNHGGKNLEKFIKNEK